MMRTARPATPAAPAALAAVFALAAAALAAQSLTVDYVLGQVDALQGTKWEPLSAGSSVDVGATLRLAAEAVVDLSSGGARVTLAAPGTYLVRDLVAQRAASDRDFGSFLKSTLRGLLVPPPPRASHLGARAGEVRSQPNVWVDEEETTLDAAMALLREGRAQEAQQQLAKSRKDASDTAAFDFLIAYAAALEGRGGAALSILRASPPGPSTRFREEALALHAQLALDAGSYAEAVQAARACLAEQPAGPRAQSASLVEGLALRAAGSSAEARVSLERAVRMGPDTEAGRLAARELGR